MDTLTSLTIYAFEDQEGDCDGKHLTLDAEKAKRHAEKHHLCAVAHKYDWVGEKVLCDCRNGRNTTPEESSGDKAEAAAKAYRGGGSLADAASILEKNIPKTKALLIEMGVTIRGRGRPKRA